MVPRRSRAAWPLHDRARVRAILLTILLVACAGGGGGGADHDAGQDAGMGLRCEGALPAWAEAVDAATLRARCGDVALEVAAFEDGLVRLRYDAPPARPWQVAPPAPAREVAIGGDGDAAVLCAPALTVRVDAACRITITDASGATLVADGEAGGWDGASLVRATPPGERFYGFGERTGGLDRRGRRLVFWNTDAYDPAIGGWRIDQDPLYVAIPIAIGLRDGVAYGVFTDDARRLEVDVARDHPERLAVHVPAPARGLDQWVIAGPSLREVVRRYTGLTGRTPLPPRWALGYHQSRWGYAPAARVTELARGFRDRGLPADALWLDIQHMRGFRTFTWDPVAFPDPVALAGALAADAFALVVIADPGLKVDPGWDVYDDAVAGDHLLRRAGGAIYEGVAWPGPSAFPDFTRAETRAWWGARIGALVGLGVDGVWLDLNEPTTFPEGGGGTTIPDDVPTASGAPMGEVHNVYATLEAQATFEGLRAAAPARRPFVLSRAGSPGIQRWAAVWTGDAPSTWDTLAGTLPMLLGMGLSGVPFVGSDVGGYSGGATPELFARWIAVGSISPFFRGHVTNGVGDQEPWAFGAEVEEISRRVAAERYRLLPYLYALFAEAEATGAPVLRPLVYEFQDDPATWDLDDQAMLGPFLLIAPVLEPGATTRRVYLPAGRWFEARSGAVHDGPATVEVDVTLAALPTFARAGAIVPRWPRGRAIGHAGESDGEVLELEVFPGPPSELVLHEDDGDGYGDHRRVRYALAATADGARLTAERAGGARPAPARTLRIRVRRVDRRPSEVRLDGRPVDGWTWDDNDRALIVELADRDAFALDLRYDPALEAPAPPVTVAIEVTLPPGTPADATIHVASSATGWAHQPLERVDATTARGALEVERGAWFEYKYSRGSWDTVEKHADCAEAANRYRFGAADDAQRDVVARWRDDGC